MGTIGLRGMLAAALIASTGLLTGMASLPAGEGTPDAPAAVPAPPGEGLLQRARHRACVVSVAATRSDLRSAADRERECR